MSDQNPFTASKANFSLLVSVAVAAVLALLTAAVVGLSFWLTVFAGLMFLIVVFALMIYFMGDEQVVRKAEDILGVRLSDEPAQPEPVANATAAPEPIAPEPIAPEPIAPEPIAEVEIVETPVDPAEDPAAVPVAEPEAVPQPRAAEEEVAPVAEAAPAPAVETPEEQPAGKPEGLDAARDGQADDLKKIKGVGPKLETLLNSMGFYHFDQIAGWTDAEIAWVDANLEGFRGRVTRDEWVSQARTLSAGGETAFSEKVDKGGVY